MPNSQWVVIVVVETCHGGSRDGPAVKYLGRYVTDSSACLGACVGR